MTDEDDGFSQRLQLGRFRPTCLCIRHVAIHLSLSIGKSAVAPAHNLVVAQNGIGTLQQSTRRLRVQPISDDIDSLILLSAFG